MTAAEKKERTNVENSAMMGEPSLAWSSDSSHTEEEDDEVFDHLQTASLLSESPTADTTDNISVRSERPSAVQRSRSSADQQRWELLQAALRVEKSQHEEHREKDLISRSFSSMDQRTSVSTPARTSYGIRDRLKRLSRTQRKELLLKSMSSDTSMSRGRIHTVLSEDQDHNIESRNDIITQLKQQAFLRKSNLKGNTIKLHIYDLIHQDTLMQLPWGCVCEIGKCFTEMNSALHAVGTGAYHVGIEVNDVEYAFGATRQPNKTGVFSCAPKCSPGYQYRTTIDLGERPLFQQQFSPETKQITQVTVDGRDVIRDMAKEYMGSDYDILRKNCCTFAHDAACRLGVPDSEIPSWFRNLADSGAMTQDMAIATMDSFEPLSRAFSNCGEEPVLRTQESKDGFEIIKEDDEEDEPSEGDGDDNSLHEPSRTVPRCTTWAC